MFVLTKQHSLEINDELLESRGDDDNLNNQSLSINNINSNELSKLIQLRDEAYEELDRKYKGLDGLAKKLNTNLIVGLNDDEKDIKLRRNLFGINEIPPKRSKYLIELAYEALQDTTLIILMICAFISIGLSFYHGPEDAQLVGEEFRAKEKEASLEWIEGIAILIAVIVVVFVTAFNDWRKEKQFRGLKSRIDQENLTSVVRNGQIKQINVKDLVVGDVCFIKYGDIVPADGLIIQSNDIKVDESSLTGETNLVKKNETKNIVLLSGTYIMEGSGKYLVTAVGLKSQTGIILTLLDATKETNDLTLSEETETKDPKKSKKKTHRSVLQAKLSRLAIQIGYVGMLAALLTFILLLSRLVIEEFLIKNQPWSQKYIHYILSFLIQCVTVIVVAVPEGLPLAVTLSLAYAVRQMTKDNNLVRHLDACETMGSATTICSDKTGTLTTNRMTVVQCYFGNKYYETLPQSTDLNNTLKERLFECISINTNYTSKLEEPRQSSEMKNQIGNKTECALLGFVEYLGGDYISIRDLNPMESFKKVFSFNSIRKMMSTIVKSSETTRNYRLFTKGAPEIVLGKCSKIINADGSIDLLTNDNLKNIKKTIEKMSLYGLRTISLAYKDINFKNIHEEAEYDWENEEKVVSNLCFISLVGIEDPVRAEVPEAIKKCQKSGVVVRMITGDNINTARSIAIKCGIIKPSDGNFLVLDSKEFNVRIRNKNGEIDQRLMDQVWPRLRVLARSSPQDKYNLVNGIVESRLSPNREVVAVTGDGTNDGPALKLADVGFAMGIQGTDVAKEASDIILTDDNFSSIVKAMMWGRNVYDSIAKFLQFQLTANLTAGLLSIICAATITAVPIKAVQMLWVNLVMDTLASLALGTEPPTNKLLERKPYGRTKPIISKTMIKNIVFQSIYQLIVIFVLVWFIEDLFWIDSIVKYKDYNKLKEPSQHFTMVFNTFVLMTLFNEINSRKIHNERNVFEGILNNSFFYSIWFICLISQVIIVNFGGIAFNIVKLDFDHWLWCFVFGIGSLLWGQLVISIPSKLFKPSKLEKPEKALMEEEETALSPILDKKLIWLRSIKRIRQQLKVVSAFKSRLEELKEKSNELGSMVSIQESYRSATLR